MLFSPRRPLLLVPVGICFIFIYLNRAWFLNNTYTYTSTKTPVDSKPTPTAAPNAPIPEKLWYKLGPNGLSSELQGYIDTCVNSNPTFTHEFMTDASGDAFVKEHFSTRPDIIDTFLAIRIPIIKADILRYLILYEYGGIWNDLDVSCEGVPIREWIPAEYKEKAAIVVGLEFDVDIWVRQFASWTIMAKAKSPHMWQVVEDCFAAIHEKTKEHNVGIGELTLDMTGDVVDFSGPRRLTRGVLKSLSSTLNKEVGNEDIAHVAEPRLIADVLVLPDYSFANSMNEQYGDKGKGLKLVTHHYAGSWKNAQGGETPVNQSSSS